MNSVAVESIVATGTGSPDQHDSNAEVAGLTSIWCCPACRGPLQIDAADAHCRRCDARYPSIGGILDLRLRKSAWIEFDADTAAAKRLLALGSEATAAQMARHVFSSRSDWDGERVESRVRQLMSEASRLMDDLEGWLKPATAELGVLLDLGCGPGMLMAALGTRRCIGIDVSLEWLVVAAQVVREAGGTPVLAAALAEALPLADEAVACVVSLDVIEHVADPRPYLREISRVTMHGGFVAVSTPNRYSLTAEPHVSIWGVGWLPRSLQKRYVKWRSGHSYDFVRLMGSRELRSIFRRYTALDFRIHLPEVPQRHVAGFRPRRAALAKCYNRLVGVSALRWLFLAIAPFYQVSGYRRRLGSAGRK